MRTLSRTFNTSFTTIIVLLIIFIFGGEVLRGFIFRHSARYCHRYLLVALYCVARSV